MGRDVCPRYPSTQGVFPTEGHLSPGETAPAHTHPPHTCTPLCSHHGTHSTHMQCTRRVQSHTHTHTTRDKSMAPRTKRPNPLTFGLVHSEFGHHS